MVSAIEFAKGYLIPGSTGFLLLGLGIGVVLLYPQRTARWGRRCLTTLFLLYATLSVPAVAMLIERGRLTRSTITTAADAPNVSAIVVLGNGAVTFGEPGLELDLPGRNTVHNVLEAARLHRLLGGTRIVVSGGIPTGGVNRRPESDIMADYLARLGVPADAIVRERESVNTWDQAQRVSTMLGANARCVLVTSPTHMARAAAAFRARNVDVIPAPSGATAGVDDGVDWPDLLPDRWALRASERAIYERLGSMYYLMAGSLQRHDVH